MNVIKNKLIRLLLNKGLFAGAGLLIIGVAVFFTMRVQPRAEKLDKTQLRLGALNRQIKEMMRPPATLGEVEQLRKELAKRNRELEDQRDSIHDVGPFASLKGSAELQSLNLELSELAASTEVRIRQRSSFIWPETKDEITGAVLESTDTLLASAHATPSQRRGPFLEQQFVRDVYGDSLQQFEIEATCAGLIAFVDGLDQLQRPVVIVRFEIHVTDDIENSTAGPILKSVLVLAM